MKMTGAARLGMGWWLLAAGVALGQAGTGSSLPAALPTAPAQMVNNTTAAASAPKLDASRRAQVTWAGGELTIAAENSSMNQILREISRATGMKVTGGVADERVYGTYGPGAPDEVLRTLLTGTGTNMLLKESAEGAPVELALTPRQGGTTPPGPGSSAGRVDEREDDLPPQQQGAGSRGRPGFGRPAFPDAPAAPNAGGAPGASPAQAAGTEPGTDAAATPAPAAATTDAQSPNGVKTPQQIYDQLMQLQKQKAAQPPPQ